jgi:hypothetical protein
MNRFDDERCDVNDCTIVEEIHRCVCVTWCGLGTSVTKSDADMGAFSRTGSESRGYGMRLWVRVRVTVVPEGVEF